MILYKTKYYGLLSDRVYKAIKESKLDPSKIEKMETNALFRQGKHMPLTSKRTKENLKKEYELLDERIGNETDKAYDKIYLKKDELDRIHKKAIEDYIKQQTKLNPNYRDYKDPYLDKLKDRFYKIEKKQKDYDFKRFDELNSNNREVQDRLNDKYYEITDKLEDEWFKNKKLSEDEIYDAKLNLKRSDVQNLIGAGNSLDNFWKKQGKDNSKLKNTKEIYENIKENARFPIVEESEKGKAYYSFNDRKVHLSEENRNPYTAYHELEHARRHNTWGKPESVERPVDGGYALYLDHPESMLNWKRYVEEEEGAASRAGFVNTFLNKKTGGADWRNAHHGFRGSMGSYNATMSVDIDKHGLLNQDYNMKPRVLERFKENAKKLGIDLNKSAKVQYTKATPEEREKIKKYIDELYNKD